MSETGAHASPPDRSGARGWLVLAVLAGALFLWLYFVGKPNLPFGATGRAIGRRLPYFRLDPLFNNAKPVAQADLEGRVSVVNYWGTWCPPCLEELPHYIKLAEELADRESFRMYLVSCGPRDDTDPTRLREETEAFIERQMIQLPIYADQNFAARAAMVSYLDLGTMAYPTTLVFDRHGLIQWFSIGYAPGDERKLRALVLKLLDDKSR